MASRWFAHTASQAAFLLGGIGTGNVSVGARGDLRDWELFNRPGKGLKIPFSFFAIHCRPAAGSDRAPVTRILEAPVPPPFGLSNGLHPGTVAGLPHLRSSRMRGEYPFAQVEFSDDTLPAAVSLEAFTPFIPLDADDSGLPCALLRYRVSNGTEEALTVSIAGSLPNVIGFSGVDPAGTLTVQPGGRNVYREDTGFRGLFFTSAAVAADSLDHGSMSLATTDDDASCRPAWLEGGWVDGIQDFWDDFSDDGRLVSRPTFDAPASRQLAYAGHPPVGSLCVTRVIGAGAQSVFTFVLAWHFPNRPRAWRVEQVRTGTGPVPTVRNHYAARFQDAWAVIAYLVQNLDRLEGLSRSFHDALFGSTLPPAVIDALASNITVIRSPTCFRLEDGTFVSWEGCYDQAGCCEGSCTHVWNYAQTLAFLFPVLERSLLRVAFNLETGEDGRMAFRSRRVFGLPQHDMLPAADGQLGAVVRLYRDWKLCADEGFLRAAWPPAARCIEYALAHWDTDGDFVLDGEQHNTYDIEFHGQEPYANTIFLAALKAGAEIAAHLGDGERGARYARAFEEGRRRADALLWNGAWYVQRAGDVNRFRYQYGEGCLSDQLLGQSLAVIAGIGPVLPSERVRGALLSVFRHNFKEDLRETANAHRSYVLDGEAGLLLCSWPRGGRPRLPFPYADEVWTGVEYQVAAHLLHEGCVVEGLRLVDAVRARHDGVRRSPWDEVECGHHYVRSMASWGLLIAGSGFQYDLPRGRISFSPRIDAEDFRCFFSTGSAWGTYRQRVDPASGRRTWEIDVRYGSLEGIRVNEPG